MRNKNYLDDVQDFKDLEYEFERKLEVVPDSRTKEAVSTMAWVVILVISGLILSIPFVGPFLYASIMLVIAFVKDINPNLRNYARAMLIILIFLLIILFLIPDYKFIK